MKKTRIRIALVIQNEKGVLLVKHQKHGATYWLIPGGGLEYCESIEACAIRELWEETGLDVEVGDLLLVAESIPPDQHRHVLNLYYEGRIVGGQLKLGDEEILAGVEFLPVEKLTEIDLRPPVGRELVDCLKNPGKTRRISLGNRWDTC